MKTRWLFFLGLVVLTGCKSGGDSSGEPVPEVSEEISEVVDPFVGVWERPCSPIDDVVTQEIFSDAELLPLWWIERLTVEESQFEVSRTVYSDEECQTDWVVGGEPASSLECRGEVRAEMESMQGYELTSFVYKSIYPEDCDIAAEPSLNVYLVGDRLYRAFYPDLVSLSEGIVFVDFNVFFEKVGTVE